jgi:UPF0716 protein FxsA
VTGTVPQRPRLVLPLLVLGFIVVSVAEVWLLTAVGSAIGIPWTLTILIVEAVVGAWLTRREGRKAWAALTEADAALILVGGIMLILPGFFTDLIGLVCLLPLTRPLARRLVGFLLARQAAKQGLDVEVMRATFAPGTVIKGETVESPPAQAGPDTDVVTGEIEA